jgi:hypothetical protein
MFGHLQVNKLLKVVRSDLPTNICIKHNGDDKPEELGVVAYTDALPHSPVTLLSSCGIFSSEGQRQEQHFH